MSVPIGAGAAQTNDQLPGITRCLTLAATVAFKRSLSKTNMIGQSNGDFTCVETIFPSPWRHNGRWRPPTSVGTLFHWCNKHLLLSFSFLVLQPPWSC